MIGIRRALLSASMVVLVLTTSVGVATVTGAAAGAQTQGSCQALVPNYEGTATVTVDKTQAKPGDTVTIVGKGFPPGAEVKVLGGRHRGGHPDRGRLGRLHLRLHRSR